MKTILVTGGAGFIGSHLCRRLWLDGNHVICLDNCYTGTIDNLDHIGMRHDETMLLSTTFEFVRHDVVEPYLAEVDEIYHLACPASPVHYQHNPVKTIKTNVLGTYNMLGLAKRVDAKILLSSTSEVYGDPAVHPQPESYWGNVNPVGIRSCYDEGKRVAETLMSDYHRQHGIQIRIARIFNTFGTRMSISDGRVVTNFICQMLRNEPVTIYGDGKQTRSFCYVSDLVEGLIRLTASDCTDPVNLGNDAEVTILELASATEKAIIERRASEGTGRFKAKIVHGPLPQDDPVRRRPDLTRAKAVLGYDPQVTLEEGIRDTVAYFWNRLASNGTLRRP